MAIQIVTSYEEMKNQLGIFTDSGKRGSQLCATLIGVNDCEVEISYLNGYPFSYSVRDTRTNELIQTNLSAVFKYGIDFPASIPVFKGTVKIFGCGHIKNNKVTFYTTDFIYEHGEVEHYSDRINVLSSWGFNVAEVSIFPIGQALEIIEQIKLSFPKAYGLFISRDVKISNRIEAPFFYRF